MKTTAAALATALFAAMSGQALATEMTAPKPTPVTPVQDSVSIKAVVTAIDQKNRTVDLKGPEGNIVTLVVDPSVTRFSQMKVGDMVTAHYYQSADFEVLKPGTPAAPDTVTLNEGKFSGAKPGGAAGAVATTTVTVLGVDKAAGVVKFRTSDGEVKDYHVRHRENLDRVKAGDMVKVTQTEALMVNVEPAK